MDPEGIDLAASDDVELIGFDSPGVAAEGSRKAGDGYCREITDGVVRDVLLADASGFGLGEEYVTETRVARVVAALRGRSVAPNDASSAAKGDAEGDGK